MTCLSAVLVRGRRADISSSVPRLLILDTDFHGNVDDDNLAALLAVRCRCMVARGSRDVTSLVGVAAVLVVHSPMARRSYEVWCLGLSSRDVFTTVVSQLLAQRRRRQDTGDITTHTTPVYHVCYSQPDGLGSSVIRYSEPSH